MQHSRTNQAETSRRAALDKAHSIQARQAQKFRDTERIILDETRDGVRFQLKLSGPFPRASAETGWEYKVDLVKSVSDAEAAVWRLPEGHKVIWEHSIVLAYEEQESEGVVIADAEIKLRKKRDLVEVLLGV